MKFIIILICSFLFSTSIYAQSDNTLIIGSWRFDKISMVDSTEIPANIIECNKGIVLTFNKNGTCNTVKKTYSKIIKLGTGRYEMSKDSKFLTQDENKMLIITLNKNELIFRASENVIMKFKRL